MDPINILVALIIIVSLGANLGSVRTGFKSSAGNIVEKPKSYLQKIPPNFAAIVLLIEILGVFKIGTLKLESEDQFFFLRTAGLICFALFSWLQVVSAKSLGKSYSQEVVIIRGQSLKTDGVFRFVRHPQYLGQILSDIGAGAALLSYLVIPLVILVELPLFILRARLEERLLTKHFTTEFELYKKKSGFMIPFVG